MSDSLEFLPAPEHQRFCTQCGSPLTRMCPPGDTRERDTCLHCGAVHYKNPLVVVGAIPIYKDKVLLCKRAIEPRSGFWTFPAGFMELHETTAQGAARETVEEAGIEVIIRQLYAVINVPHISQVHTYYLASVTNPTVHLGEESLEARYFTLDEIPWDALAFKTISTTLTHYVNDLKADHFQMHHYTLDDAS